MKGGKRERKTWAHKDGTPIEELQPGLWYEGKVSYKTEASIFIDIGATYDAILKIPPYLGADLTVGMEFPVELLKVDVQRGELLVQKEKPKLVTGESKGKDKGKSKGKGKGKRASTPQSHVPLNFKRQADHDERTTLNELESGSIVTGTVKNVGRYGIFFDIGAQSDARLFKQPMDIELQVGDVVDLVIDWVNTDTRRIQVSLVDAVDPRRAPARSDSIRTSKQSKQSTAYFDNVRYGVFANLKKGMLCDGVVMGKSSNFVFVDIGFDKDGYLQVAPEFLPEFQIRDEVIGMEVTSIDHRKDEVYLSLEDPAMDDGAARNKTPPRKSPPAVQKNQKFARPIGEDPYLPSVGSMVDGAITRITASMVYVDIGTAKEGHLHVPPDLRRQFRKKDLLRGMIVESLNLEVGHAVLTLEDPVMDTRARASPTPKDEPRAGQAAASTKGQQQDGTRGNRPASVGISSPGRTTPLRQRPVSSGPRNRPARQSNETARSNGRTSGQNLSRTPERTPEVRKKPALDHPNGKPLQDFKVGDEVTGVVTKLSDKVFLDFGAVVDGILELSEDDVKKFRLGDQIEDALIDFIDLKRMRVALSIPWELTEPCDMMYK